QPHQRVVLVAALLAVTRGPDGTGDRVAAAQTVPLDLGHGDVDIVRPGQVPGGPHEGVVVEDVDDAGHLDQDVVLGHLRLALATAALAAVAALAAADTHAVPLAPAPPAVPEAAAPAAAAAVAVVVRVA